MGKIYVREQISIPDAAYVGDTDQSFKDRTGIELSKARNTHDPDHNRPFIQAIVKYGIKDFKPAREVAYSDCYYTRQYLEQAFIEKYKSHRKFGNGKGYNARNQLGEERKKRFLPHLRLSEAKIYEDIPHLGIKANAKH